MLSYVRWQLFPYRVEDTFEHWVTNRFGRRLFRTFFKTYTEKVWGIPCSELKAEWAAQRIKDLSLRTVLVQMYLKPRRTIRTLIEEFDYPRLGPGMMWEPSSRRSRAAAARCGSTPTSSASAGRACGSTIVAIAHGKAARRLVPGDRLHLEHAAGRAGAEARPAGAARGARGGAAAPLPRLPHRVPDREARRPVSRQLDLRPRSRRCRSGASRTSRTGAPTWCPTRRRRASGSSTSATRATSSGPCPTRT